MIEYQLSNNFEKNDFKFPSITEKQLINIVTDEGGFSCSVSFLSDLSLIAQKRSNLIQIASNDYRQRSFGNTDDRIENSSQEKASGDSHSPYSLELDRKYETFSDTTPRKSPRVINQSQENVNNNDEARLRRSTIPLFLSQKSDSFEILSDDRFTLETPPNSSFNSNRFTPFRESSYYPCYNNSSDIINTCTPRSKGVAYTTSVSSLSEGEGERKPVTPQETVKSPLISVDLENTLDQLIGSD